MAFIAKGPSTRTLQRDRKAAAFKRCYGSRERVAFVKALGCAVCGWDTKEARPGQRHSIENAHTRSGGASRKADADTIIPLCWTHHDEYDGGKKTFAAKYDFDPIARAVEVESAWQDWGEAANP